MLAIDEPNDFEGKTEKAETVKAKYEMLGLSTKPFSQVKYFYPYSTKTKSNSYAPKELFEKQVKLKKAFQIEKETGIRPHVGLLDKGGEYDNNDIIIDHLPLDYSILNEINYTYPENDGYPFRRASSCIEAEHLLC